MILENEKPVFCFGLVSANPEDAPTFKAAVDSTLSEAAQNGLNEELVETVLKTKALSDYTAMEDETVIIENIFPSICMKWAQTDEADVFVEKEKAFSLMQQDTRQTLICSLAAALRSAPHSALVTTSPQPGLAEQDEYLAEMKAAMTPEELEQMVKDTLAFDEWNASELSNSGIVIPVEDLPELEPAIEFVKKEEDGAVYYAAASEMEQISLHQVCFDTEAVPQEDLHYITLYSVLLEELAAQDYTKAQKDNLMAQYLYHFDVDTLYPKDGKNQYPMLCMEWYCMAQDYETSLRLLLDIMGGLKLDDKEELIRVLDKYLPAFDCSRKDPFDLGNSIAMAGADRTYQYEDYLTGQRFYEFARELRDRLDTDPGVMEEIVESSNYHTFSVSDISLTEGLSGSFFPFVMALNDRYIVPKIRFQGLAYSAAMGHYNNLKYIYTYTYSDPNVADTIAVIDREADALAAMELTQEELDSYILYSYSYVTTPLGNLNKYLYRMNQDLTGFDAENWRRLAAEIKSATIEDKEQAVETLQKLLENQHLVTVGNAELLQREADTFDQIYDYRKPLAQ